MYSDNKQYFNISRWIQQGIARCRNHCLFLLLFFCILPIRMSKTCNGINYIPGCNLKIELLVLQKEAETIICCITMLMIILMSIDQWKYCWMININNVLMKRCMPNKQDDYYVTRDKLFWWMSCEVLVDQVEKELRLQTGAWDRFFDVKKEEMKITSS